MRSAAFLSAVAMVALSSGFASAQTVIAPPPQIVYGPRVSLDQAKRMLAAAEAEAKKINVGMVITVVDSGGHEVMMQRLDGAQLGSIQAARDKAHSAVYYRRPTKIF
jgi:glc operon protein GlcG